jgi:Pectate lyase superfamily protein
MSQPTYGAVANGSMDATTAIQNAINAASAGDTIYFPGGTYKISSALTLVSNRNYAGEFAGSVGSVLEQSAVNTFAGSTQYNAGTTINITGLTFENGGLDFAGSGSVPANAINVQDGDRSRLRRLRA